MSLKKIFHPLKRGNITALQRRGCSEPSPYTIKGRHAEPDSREVTLLCCFSFSGSEGCQTFKLYPKKPARAAVCGGIGVRTVRCDVIVALQWAERSGLPADYPCSTYVWPVYHHCRRTRLEWGRYDIDVARSVWKQPIFSLRPLLLLMMCGRQGWQGFVSPALMTNDFWCSLSRALPLPPSVKIVTLSKGSDCEWIILTRLLQPAGVRLI